MTARDSPRDDTAPKNPASSARPLTIWRLTRQRPLTLVAALLFVLGGSGLALVQPLLVGRIIEQVENAAPVLPWVALLVAVAAGQVAAETYGGYLQQTMGEGGSRRARAEMGRAVLRSALSPLSRHRGGDVVSRFTTDADAIRDGVAHGYIQLVTAVVTAVGAGTMLWILDSALFVTVAALMLVAGAGAWLFLRRIEAVAAARQETLGAIGASVNRVLAGMRTIRVFHATDREGARLDWSFGQGYDAGVRYARWTAAVNPAVELAATGSFVALLLVGGTRVAADQISVATLVSALLYSTVLVVPVGALIEATVSVSTANGALTRINELIALPDESADRETNEGAPVTRALDCPVQTTAPDATSGLRVVGLCAGYNDTSVIDRVSLSVPRGQSLLLRGPSGSGKTTLVNVICRFVPPQAGRVLFNGIDLLRLAPEEASRHVAIAEQDAPVLDGTVRETLAYGDVNATDADMIACLESLGLLAGLGGPHHALDRALGEHGTALSGGQRQRIALARALLSKRPLLIVDEPTAGLDVLNRQRVVSALQRRDTDQTLIIISHDDNDQAWVDQVLDVESASLSTGQRGHELKEIRQVAESPAN